MRAIRKVAEGGKMRNFAELRDFLGSKYAHLAPGLESLAAFGEARHDARADRAPAACAMR